MSVILKDQLDGQKRETVHARQRKEYDQSHSSVESEVCEIKEWKAPNVVKMKKKNGKVREW